MNIGFGNHEVLYTNTVLLPEQENLWIDATIEDWQAKIKVSFLSNDEDKKAHFQMVGGDDHAHFKLYNWNKLGVCFSSPAPFGNVNGKSAYLMMHGTITGSIRKITVQISVETQK